MHLKIVRRLAAQMDGLSAVTRATIRGLLRARTLSPAEVHSEHSSIQHATFSLALLPLVSAWTCPRFIRWRYFPALRVALHC